jgi:hypothetical protein
MQNASAEIITIVGWVCDPASFIRIDLGKGTDFTLLLAATLCYGDFYLAFSY